MMMVSGGLNVENKEVYDDISIYDIKNRRWIGCTLTNPNVKHQLKRRYMHTLTTVINPKIDYKVN